MIVIALNLLEISLIIITMVVTFSDLILNIIKAIIGKKTEKNKLELERSKIQLQKEFNQAKLQLDQSKMSIDLIFSFIPSLKGIIDIDLKDPESYKKQVENIKKFTERVKDMNKPSENKSSSNK